MTTDLRFAARYPCSDAAREAADALDVGIGALATGEADAADAVVDRAQARVEATLTEGGIGRPHRTPRVEVLSYPVARVLVSLLGDAHATDVYADAEAATVRGRLDDVAGDADAADRLLAAFGLAGDGAVRATADGYEVAVGHYLDIASAAADGWRLADRPLSDGWVPIDGHEIATLLEREAATRVRDGLPVDVPPAARDALADRVDELAELVSAVDAPTTVGTPVAPAAFPPCVRALLRQARSPDDQLADRQRFTLEAFLAGTDADAGQIAALLGADADADAIADRLDRLCLGDHVEYPAPSCAGLAAMGDCVAPDGRCETVAHPGQYYAAAVDAAGDDQTPRGEVPS